MNVLEILKKKRVNLWAISFYTNVSGYNSVRENDRKLTEEEFKLVKEWLEND